MVDWKVTATTIYCDAVCDEVTLLVRNDWSMKCVGFDKYGKPDSEACAQMRKRGKEMNRQLGCEGLGCPHLVQYKEKLLAEEAGKGSSAGESGTTPGGAS